MQIARRPITKLALTNQGALDLVFLGVGSAFSKTLNQTNLFIVKGETHLLLSCGNQCSHSLFHDYGSPLTHIDNFRITPIHAYHSGRR